MAVKDRGSALEGFTALYDGTGNASATLGLSVQTKCTLETELVELCQQHGDKPHKGTPLGRFPELWPFDMLKRPLMAHADEFARQLKTKGYNARTPVTAFKVWGPYMEKVGAIETWKPEAGNHLIPSWAQRDAHKVWGYQGDEWDFSKGVTFIIVGDFTRSALEGVTDEETGVILV